MRVRGGLEADLITERAPRWAVDGGIALAVLVAHSLPFLVTVRESAPETGWTVWQYLPVLLMALPLLWRRAHPVAVLALVLLGMGLYILSDPDQAPQPVPYGTLVAVYTVAESRSRTVRRWGAALLASAAFFQAVDVVLRPPSLETASRSLVLMATAWFLGRHIAGRKEIAQRERRERERESERAALRERERIAREMHDVLGHTVSLMVVQAESGPLAVEKNPKRAVAAFDAIADTGRTAMDQVRSLVDLWQTETPPGTDDIPELVKRTDEAGERTVRLVAFSRGRGSAEEGAVAYRVVQEALTNFLRHSKGTVSEVSVAGDGVGLRITVEDNGVVEEMSVGNGLRNLRGRVESLGGWFRAGPAPTGGFRVEAEIPESPWPCG
ncbi:sensor histidine kinase [Salininema proteolyticum]|uniref:histidine kinase n=1 Tax=Salininema proteolyticum TaxID=1607685 RepID=A0ABV8U263_9ACTN